MKDKQVIGRTQYFSSKYLSILAHGKRKNLVFRITKLQFGDSDSNFVRSTLCLVLTGCAALGRNWFLARSFSQRH